MEVTIMDGVSILVSVKRAGKPQRLILQIQVTAFVALGEVEDDSSLHRIAHWPAKPNMSPLKPSDALGSYSGNSPADTPVPAVHRERWVAQQL